VARKVAKRGRRPNPLLAGAVVLLFLAAAGVGAKLLAGAPAGEAPAPVADGRLLVREFSDYG